MSKSIEVLLLLDHSRSFGKNIVHGIAKYARLHSRWSLLLEPEFHSDTETNWRKIWAVDGIIGFCKTKEQLKQIMDTGVPAVILSADNQEYSEVLMVVDDAAVGEMAANYMLRLGLKNYAYLGGKVEWKWSQERGNAYKNVIEKAGFEVNIYKHPASKTGRIWKNEKSYLVEWLKSLPKPIGIMACSDDRAVRLVEACQLAGLYIPSDVAIIGVDNDDISCDISSVQISSIALNTQRPGYEAAEMLDKLIHGKKFKKKTLIAYPTHVAERQSTDILQVPDKDLVSAIRYIKERSLEMIQVSDVANHVALSRRALEKKFQNILGRTVHGEVKRIRIDKIVEMLMNSDKTITEIARILNFSSTKHISRYFSKEKRMNCVEYRKRFGKK
jgi:LacI family transcriptional regulator